MSTLGFTLGKFAPLHNGHCYLIEAAQQQVDHLIVIIYDAPEVTPIPLSVRARWIRTLFPDVEVIEAWMGPPDTGMIPEVMQKQEDFLLDLLKGRPITHFFSSEPYGEHVSAAFGAKDIRIDMPRQEVPISGTEIRKAPYVHRKHIPTMVYPDLITHVVFMGAPSTGKTTLCSTLAQRFGTHWMPEYGREYWDEHQVDRRLTPEQLVEIAEVHQAQENEHLLKANQFLFTDTNAITTYMFALDYHQQAHPRLTQLALEAQSRYDLVFVCDTDIPYEDTWERSGAVYRERFQKQILADLHERKLGYFLLSGSLEERVETCTSVLNSFTKYSNPLHLTQSVLND